LPLHHEINKTHTIQNSTYQTLHNGQEKNVSHSICNCLLDIIIKNLVTDQD